MSGTRADVLSSSTVPRSAAHTPPAPPAPAHVDPGAQSPKTGTPPADRPATTAEIVARAEPSVALLADRQGSGTGFLVGQGLLVTGTHVLDGEIVQNMEVRFPSASEGRRGPYRGELLDQDPARDLAFLAVPTDLPPPGLARGHAFRKGEDVIGNPGLGAGRVLEASLATLEPLAARAGLEQVAQAAAEALKAIEGRN